MIAQVKYIGLLYAACCLLQGITLCAQNNDLRFSHLTVEDGLADNYVHGIFMDRVGYMWFATQDGLSRYNGTSFKNFRQVLGDSTSLNFQIAMDVVQDDDGILWVATLGGGLNRFDPETETFKAYYLPVGKNSLTTGKPFSKVLIDTNGNIWCGTYDMGLCFFDKKKEEFINYPLNNEYKNLSEAFRRNSVIDLIEDIEDSTILWIAGNNGLYRFDKNKREMQYMSLMVRGQLDTISSFRSVYMEKPGELWIGAWTHGLIRYYTANKEWEFFPHNKEEWEKGNVSVNIIFDIVKKSPSEFWLASKDEGLISFDLFTKKFTFYKHDPFNGNSILSDDVEALYKDRSDRLWISNFHRGVSILDPSDQLYNLTEIEPPGKCPSGNVYESYDAAYDIYRDKLYVTTVGCGALTVFNKKSEGNLEFERTVFVTPDLNARLNVLVDTKKRVWIAGVLPTIESPYSLYLYDPVSGLLKPFEHPLQENLPIHNYLIQDVLEDSKNNIWFSTSFGGVFELKAHNNSMVQYIRSPANPDYPANYMEIVHINEDSKGDIWFSAIHDGLFKLELKKVSFTHFPTFSFDGNYHKSERVMCSMEGPEGKVWVGVEWNGVWIFDPSLPGKQNMLHYGIESGLPGSKVARIIKDKNDVLWLRTSQGVCWFDATTRKFNVFGEKGRNNYSSLGTEGMSMLRSGELFVGMNNSFYTFNPTNFGRNDNPPPIVFSTFYINNQPHRFEKNLNHMEKIVLGYDQNYFSISFSALNYTQPENNRYAYILEGYDKEWVYPAKGLNLATYTKVREGQYTFRVKAANNDGIWNEEGISLDISVLPPIHRRWWAFLLYAIVLSAVFYFLRKHQVRRMIEQSDNLRLKELDALKTKLYTNITHEFRTPLTVIMGMTEQLREEAAQPDGRLAKYVMERGQLILQNAGNLLRLINQMLSLSKLESGKLNINWENGDVVIFLQYLSESFHSFAENKKIRLTFYPEIQALKMDYDPEKLQQIISNLLSNAIKFTPKGGQVFFHVSELGPGNGVSEKMLQIKITDSGIGIPSQHLSRVFDRFYQVDDTQNKKGEGTGIGLTLTRELTELMGGSISVESELGKGTRFTVLLPISNKSSVNTNFQAKSLDTVGKEIPLKNKVLLKETVIPDKNGASINSGKPLLLIVEDNHDVALYIRTCLEDQYSVIWAENGQIGIDKAVERIPDMIVSDVMMPEKDGLEVTQYLKNDMRTSHIPIILLTAKADIDSRIAGYERGADAYLAKPFDKKELLVRIQKLVELRRKLQARYAGSGVFQLKPAVEGINNTSTEDNETKLEDAFLQKVNAVIENHLSDATFEVPTLCRAVRMSQSQLYRKIKALTDKSIAAYIRSYRLHKGRNLLQSSDLNVSEVAYEVGFTDPAYFSRTFSEEFGLPPNELRK